MLASQHNELNRKQSGQLLKTVTTMLASQHIKKKTVQRVGTKRHVRPAKIQHFMYNVLFNFLRVSCMSDYCTEGYLSIVTQYNLT